METNESHLPLLGQPARALYEVFGKPIAEYDYRGNTTILFEYGSNTIVCECETGSDGRILSINALKERRKSVRIRPEEDKPAYISFDSLRMLSTIVDISSHGALVKIHTDQLPKKGSKVTLCTTVATWNLARHHLRLVGTVYKLTPGERTAVILFDGKYTTQSHSKLQEYIDLTIIKYKMGAPLLAPPPLAADRCYTIIKSDACSLACDVDRCLLC